MASHSRHVRFTLPPGHQDRNDQPPSILRRPTGHHLPDIPGSPNRDPIRRSSLPDMRHSTRHLNERRVRALEALCDMRSFLMQACNFDRDEHRRALTSPSIHALSALIAYVNALRGDIDRPVTNRLEHLLHHMNIDNTSRHPHEQLAPPEKLNMSKHEENARRGHKKRLRRESDYRLLELTSGLLKIKMRTLRDLTPAQLEQRELDALKVRLQRFNAPRNAIGLARPPIHIPTTRSSSVPNSPLGRRTTIAQSPQTDPNKLRRAYQGEPFDDLFPVTHMAELSLGSSISSTGPSNPYVPPPLPPTTQPPPHAALGSSPYASPRQSPYIPPAGTTYSAPPPAHTSPQTYTPYPAAASHVVYHGTPPQQPYQSPYATTGSTTASSAYPSTPPQLPAAYPPGSYAPPPSGVPGYAHAPAWPSPGGTRLSQPGGVPSPYGYNPHVAPPPPPAQPHVSQAFRPVAYPQPRKY